ncbi:MAG: TRAP transporter small permease subunit, partial [Spirochaetales bacterium]
MFSAVFFRYVLVSPIVWSEEITGFFLVWMVLLGAPVGYRTKEHVAIDFLTKKIPLHYQPFIRILHALIILFVSGIIVFFGLPHTL